MTRKATKSTSDIQISLDQTHSEVGELRSEVGELRKVVVRLDGYREGTMSTLQLGGLIVAVLGIAGVISFVNSAIENQVSSAIEGKIAMVDSQVQTRLDLADESVSRAEDAVGRAENAVGRAESESSNARFAAATSEAALSGIFTIATQITISESAGEWIVAIAAVDGLQEAIREADRVVRADYEPVIFFFDNLYVVAIGPFETKENAEIARLAVQSTLRGSPGLHDLQVACPYRTFNLSGYFDCFLEPTPVPTNP